MLGFGVTATSVNGTPLRERGFPDSRSTGLSIVAPDAKPFMNQMGDTHE
jgi:hypothetical protein